MATTHPNPYQLHDHAGARWLAVVTTPILFLILAAFAMMIYPHVR
jgi:hypothetical protein